jgi:hypothetical protein
MNTSFDYYIQKDDSIKLLISDDDLTHCAVQHWEAMIKDEGLSAAIESVEGVFWEEAEINVGVYGNIESIIKKLKEYPDVISAAQQMAIDAYSSNLIR